MVLIVILQTYLKDLITRLLISNLLYLRRMPHIGPRPPSLSTGNSKNSIRFFRIPFGGGIENPFEPHIPRGITNHVTRNFHRFPRSHAINILLLRPAVRLVCKVKPKFLCEMHFYKDFMSRKGHLFNFLRARRCNDVTLSLPVLIKALIRNYDPAAIFLLSLLISRIK